MSIAAAGGTYSDSVEPIRSLANLGLKSIGCTMRSSAKTQKAAKGNDVTNYWYKFQVTGPRFQVPRVVLEPTPTS